MTNWKRIDGDHEEIPPPQESYLPQQVSPTPRVGPSSIVARLVNVESKLDRIEAVLDRLLQLWS